MSSNLGSAVFLAHPSDSLEASYCHRPMSVVRHTPTVVCRKQFTLNDIFSDITRPRTLTFGMKHCLEDVYQFCSIGDPRVHLAQKLEFFLSDIAL